MGSLVSASSFGGIMTHLITAGREHDVLVDILVLCFSSRKRKLSGFGHRVYKNYDPRAKVLRKLTEEVFSIVGRDPLIEVVIHFLVTISVLPVCYTFLKLDMLGMRPMTRVMNTVTDYYILKFSFYMKMYFNFDFKL